MVGEYPSENAFQNIVGKGENACLKTNFNFSVSVYLFLSSANAFSLDQSKNLLFGKQLLFCKQLTLYHTIPTFNYPKEEGFLKLC